MWGEKTRVKLDRLDFLVICAIYYTKSYYYVNNLIKIRFVYVLF